MGNEITERLAYLRSQIEAEQISYGEIAELQSLAEHIDSGDVLLLEWAGVPEFSEGGTAMTVPPILLPGDDASRTDDYTSVKVIASQWGNDRSEHEPLWFVALLLHPTAPCYEVVDYTWRTDPGAEGGHWDQTTSHGFEYKINDAVRLFADNGGDN